MDGYEYVCYCENAISRLIGCVLCSRDYLDCGCGAELREVNYEIKIEFFLPFSISLLIVELLSLKLMHQLCNPRHNNY